MADDLEGISLFIEKNISIQIIFLFNCGILSIEVSSFLGGPLWMNQKRKVSS